MCAPSFLYEFDGRENSAFAGWFVRPRRASNVEQGDSVAGRGEYVTQWQVRTTMLDYYGIQTTAAQLHYLPPCHAKVKQVHHLL